MRLLALLLSVQFLVPSYFCDGHNHEFADEKEVRDESHIKEHLQDKIDISKMNDEQLTFHYFNMFDVNHDKFIDGLEISGHLISDTGKTLEILKEDNIEKLVDDALEKIDKNKDGLIDFAELKSKLPNRESNSTNDGH